VSDVLDPWRVVAAPGLPLFVNGTLRHLRALSLVVGPGALPVWEADVDGSRGCAGTFDSAVFLAARAAEKDPPGGQEVTP
jgi:hypothetical protein